MTDDELAKAIVADYAAKDAKVAAEKDAHLAAGQPLGSFTPTTVID